MRLLHTASFVVQVTETIPRSMTLGSRSMALVKLRFAHVLASLHVRLCRERHI